jgi:hypothetical protein
MRKKELDEIAVAESTNINFSPYDRERVTTEGQFMAGWKTPIPDDWLKIDHTNHISIFELFYWPCTECGGPIYCTVENNMDAFGGPKMGNASPPQLPERFN